MNRTFPKLYTSSFLPLGKWRVINIKQLLTYTSEYQLGAGVDGIPFKENSN